MSTQATKIFYYTKGADRPLGAHLRSPELDCRCKYYSCKRTLITEVTIESFRLTREEFGMSIYINSAFRCQRHNTDVGGVGDSRHKLGLALDLCPPDPIDLDLLERIARKHFDVVIRYETFVHCHNEEGIL